MTTIRAKDLPLQSPPVGADSIEVDSAAGGTRRVLVSELMAGDSSLTAVSGRDDFDDPQLTGWTLQTQAGGQVQQFPSTAALGLLPGSGVAILDVAAGATDAAMMEARGVGLALDATVPIVAEWRLLPTTQGVGAVYSDNQCAWSVGLCTPWAIGGAPGTLIALSALWSGGVRSYRATIWAAGAETSGVVVTLPTPTTSLRLRISALTTDVVLEAAVDDGAFAVVVTTGLGAPAGAIYSPFCRVENSGGSTGLRALCVDYVAHDAKRAALVAGAAVSAGGPVLRPVPPPTVSGVVPGVNNDSTTGIVVGSVWVNGVDIYMCSSPAVGAAVWAKISP